MKILSLLFLFASLATGCNKIEGQLNVSKAVSLITSKGVSRNLQVGTYEADIKANTKKKITLRLNNDSDEKYEFNIPNGTIPSNGSFAYKSSTIGQPVDLKGSVATASTNGPRRQTTESCQWQEAVQVCQPLPNGGVACSVVYQTRYGSRWITYYDRTTTQDITLSITAANVVDESAQFLGNAVWVDRIVIGENQCR
jgi:hypothetical protein